MSGCWPAVDIVTTATSATQIQSRSYTIFTALYKGKGKKRKQSHIVTDRGSDRDDSQPSIEISIYRYVYRSLPSDGALCSKLTTIKDEIQVIRQDMQCLFQMDKRMQISMALYQKLSEAP